MPSPKAWHKCAEARPTCLGCVHSISLLSQKIHVYFHQKCIWMTLARRLHWLPSRIVGNWHLRISQESERSSSERRLNGQASSQKAWGSGIMSHVSEFLAEACRCAILVASLLSLLARICQDREDYWATYSAFDWEFYLHLVTSASKCSDTSLFPRGIRCCLAVVLVQLLLFTCAEYRATIRVRVIHLKWAAPRAFFFQSVPYAMITSGSLQILGV